MRVLSVHKLSGLLVIFIQDNPLSFHIKYLLFLKIKRADFAGPKIVRT